VDDGYNCDGRKKYLQSRKYFFFVLIFLNVPRHPRGIFFARGLGDRQCKGEEHKKTGGFFRRFLSLNFLFSAFRPVGTGRLLP
jgi:hypothetical protein